jgi:photosystem II stability/assembly factor-like uncharacterized protein
MEPTPAKPASAERADPKRKRWTRVGNLGGEPAAFLARSRSELYVALHDGTVEQSKDGGRTWSVRSTP